MQRTNTTILFPDAGKFIYVEFKQYSVKLSITIVPKSDPEIIQIFR